MMKEEHYLDKYYYEIRRGLVRLRDQATTVKEQRGYARDIARHEFDRRQREIGRAQETAKAKDSEP